MDLNVIAYGRSAPLRGRAITYAISLLYQVSIDSGVRSYAGRDFNTAFRAVK